MFFLDFIVKHIRTIFNTDMVVRIFRVKLSLENEKNVPTTTYQFFNVLCYLRLELDTLI